MAISSENTRIYVASSRNKMEVKMESIVLKCENISKKYNGHTILDNINLSVMKGEIIAFVGSNGCGKSTLIRILSGLTKPSGGSIRTSLNTKLGLIPDHFEKINLSIPKFMMHMQAMEGNEKKPEILHKYYHDFYLDNMLDTPMKYLSKGTLQKVAVIQALISNKDVLFMDEPLSGQDTMSQCNFIEEMRKRKEAGMAIVMACHEANLIEELADRILQLKNGKLVDGTEYMYSHRKPRCVFLVQYKDERSNIANLIQEYTKAEEKIIVSKCGEMCKIEADKEYSKQLFQLFLAEDVHIIKYEEIKEVC